MKYFISILPILIFCSCSSRSESNDPKIKTSIKFIKFIENNQQDSAFAMLNPRLLKGFLGTAKAYINSAHSLSEEFGISPQSKWTIEYDTMHPVFKLEKIIIPIDKEEDKTDRLKTAYISLGFDYTGIYSSDDMITVFDLRVEYR